MNEPHTKPGRVAIPKALLVSAIEESVDAIYLIEPESGLILFANRAGCESLGYSEQELAHMRVSDVQVKVVDEAQWAKLLGTMRRENSLLFRGEHQRRDGSVFPVEVHSTLLPYEGGEVMISVVRDMSGWERQEQALRSSETTLRTVLDTMGEGVLVLDALGKFTIANEAFCRLTGIDRDQIEGRKPIDNWPVIHEDGSEYPGDALPSWYTLKTRKPMRNDVQGVIRPDGQTCWLLANSEPLITVDTGEFEGVLVTLSDITDLKRKEAELDKRARTDALTQHPNRFAFTESLGETLANAGEGDQVAVLFLDMDSFKIINDSMGHETGDQLLKAVAARFTDRVEDGHSVARLGGDEFIHFVAVESDADAARWAEQLLNSLREPFDVDGRALYVSGSIGIAMYPRDGRDTVSLMKHADIAMYRAKSEGRNRFRYFSRELGELADHTLTLSSDLRQAINEQQFELHFQPIVGLDDGRVGSIEALLRWRHPVIGVIEPDQFIDLLENTGMIVEVGAWVLEQSCAAVSRLRLTDNAALSVAVNISVREFRQTGFIDKVKACLSRNGLPGSALQLELTERVLIDDELIAIKQIQGLRDLGVKVSLDDFGTGYSSLQYLHQLPVTRLKIDKSFIPEQNSDPTRDALVRTIISLGKTLSMDVVVEGVESEWQLTQMRLEGAHYVQGFLFSPAVTESQLPALLQRDWLPV